jgi:hypothetical protein
MKDELAHERERRSRLFSRRFVKAVSLHVSALKIVVPRVEQVSGLAEFGQISRNRIFHEGRRHSVPSGMQELENIGTDGTYRGICARILARPRPVLPPLRLLRFSCHYASYARYCHDIVFPQEHIARGCTGSRPTCGPILPGRRTAEGGCPHMSFGWAFRHAVSRSCSARLFATTRDSG